MNLKSLLCLGLIFSSGMSYTMNLNKLIRTSKLITQKREFSKHIGAMSSTQDKNTKLNQFAGKPFSEQKRHFSKTPMKHGILGAHAGFFTGKFLTHFVIQAGIVVVAGATAIVCPPAAIPLAIALEKTVAVPAEILSNTVGLGVGIVGAAVTGPV